MPPAGDVRRRQTAVDVRSPRKRISPAEACHSPMIVRSVVLLPAPLRPSSMVTSPSRHVEVDAVQDVVRADVRVHASDSSLMQGTHDAGLVAPAAESEVGLLHHRRGDHLRRLAIGHQLRRCAAR
jgi:hypothetical protein